jgi:hypothetical protein
LRPAVVRVEGDLAQSRRVDALVLADAGLDLLSLIRVQGIGQEPGQPQDHRPVTGVPLAGEGERAVQPAFQPRHRPGAGDLRDPVGQVG